MHSSRRRNYRVLYEYSDKNNFIGGKSGETSQAGETFAGVFDIHFPEFEKRPIAIIVLRSENQAQDIENIIHYLTQNFLYGTASFAKEKNQDPIIIREGANVYEAIRHLGQ